MPLLLYNLGLLAVIVVSLPLLLVVVLAVEKRRRTVGPRLGLGTAPAAARPGAGGGPLWMHALSVGEVNSAVPLVRLLRRDHSDATILFSASTLTGQETAGRQLSDFVDGRFYFPYDLPFSVDRRLGQVRPRLFVLVESDIWPNFLLGLERRRIPAVLVNGRLSSGAFRGYRRLKSFSARMFAAFTAICAQSEADAARFRALGVARDRLYVTGTIKYDLRPPALSGTEIAELRRILRLRDRQPVLVAGSTHAGEESRVLAAFHGLRRRRPDLVMILAPRDPGRVETLIPQVRRLGLRPVTWRRLQRNPHDPAGDVILVDVLGKLAGLYALADVAFVGGSLVSCGGHNPLEPAAVGKPVVFGPDMSDFLEPARLLQSGGGAVEVQDADQLQQAVERWLADKAAARRAGNNARRVLERHRGAAERAAEVIGRILAGSR